MIEIYAKTLCSCFVCTAEKSTRKIRDELNRINSTEHDPKWVLCKADFPDGKSNPHDCDAKDCEGKKHYFFIR